MFSADYSNPGPYPKSDRNDELQELSFKAFDAALPVDRFIFRPEPKDKGADGSVELKRDSGCTNMRAQVQLKGTDSDLVNLDGTVSVQIKTSNLKYLLNGLSPLYVLYVVPRDELRYLWARDECNRLDKLKPEWRQQEKVTIRFEEVLTPTSLDQIYGRIQQEGRLHRSIHDALARASFSEEIVVAINAATLETTDSDDIERKLLKSGLTITSCGYASLVLRQARLLKPEATASPRLQLIQGYAQFTVGRYQAAIGHLQEASLHRDELSSDDQEFLIYLRNVCDYQSGRIGLWEYHSRLGQWEQQEGSGFALAHRLDYMRHRLLGETNKVERENLLAELRALVAEMLSRTDESEAFKLQARLILLHAEGGQVVTGTIHELFRIPIRTGLRLSVDVGSTLRLLGGRWAAWKQKLDAALNEAISLGNPLLVAFALDTLATIETGLLSNMHLLLRTKEPSATIPKEAVLAAREYAEQALSIYKQADHLEGKLRSQMAVADLSLLAGQQSSAQSLAREILPQAEAMGYSSLIERATEHLTGNSVLSRLEAEVERGRTEDDDFKLARSADQEMRDIASDVLAELNLPAERLAVVEREWFSMRDIANERLQWCRHIELIQDLTHTDSPATFYRSDPERFCRCEKHGYKSAVGNPDWHAVVGAFKGAYCGTCPDRAPKVKASDNSEVD